jgi:integrase/recombinase XerC
MNQLAPSSSPAPQLPTIVATADDKARVRFLEFFAANIRNRHTRRAYALATREFLLRCESVGVASIADVKPLHVAAYIEQLGRERSPPTVKQRLAAIRQLFDWMVTGQVMSVNPASSVRGPSHSVKRGKTPVLDPLEGRQLLDAIDVTRPVGLRDRFDRAYGLFVRAHRRGARHEGRGCLRVEPPALGSPAREGRQAP